MPTFKYEVVDSNGKHKKGTLESNNIDTATAELNAGGGFIISIGLAGAMEKDISISIGSPVKAREMSIFCRQFQSVLNAGVTVLEALDMLQNQTQNKVFKKTLTELAQLVQGTIAAAAVINEIIAVIAAKKGFELAGEIPHREKSSG